MHSNNNVTIIDYDCRIDRIPFALKTIGILFPYVPRMNMIVMTVFLLIMNRAEFSLVHSREENCRYDRIHFDLKRIVIPNAFVPRTTLTCCNAMLGNLAFAVREASVSRHNGGPIKDPPLNPSIR